ncbi:MAG: hypothetical protein U0168_18205 [Nannocystaceae bacterium]
MRETLISSTLAVLLTVPAPVLAAPSITAKPRIFVRKAGGADKAKDSDGATRLEHVRKLLGKKTKAKQLQLSFRLTVHKPAIDEDTYLEIGPAYVGGLSGLAYLQGSSTVFLGFPSVAGRAYMLDCIVGGATRIDLVAWDHDEKTGTDVDHSPVTQDVDGNHVYFLLSPTAGDSWRGQWIVNHGETEWVFRSCEVTPIEV